MKTAKYDAIVKSPVTHLMSLAVSPDPAARLQETH